MGSIIEVMVTFFFVGHTRMGSSISMAFFGLLQDIMFLMHEWHALMCEE